MEFFRSPLTWLRLTFRWSNSTQTWQEHIGDAVLILAVVGCRGHYLFCRPGMVASSADLGHSPLAAPVLNRMGWLKVFGPVLYYDMIRQCGAAVSRFCGFSTCWCWCFCFSASWSASPTSNLGPWTPTGPVIAEKYFTTFMVAQFITVVLLTPAYVAGAIAEEKDRKTLEFMLATDLLNREIVLSKLLARAWAIWRWWC